MKILFSKLSKSPFSIDLGFTLSSLVPSEGMIAALSMRLFLNALTALPAGTKLSFRSAGTPPGTIASVLIYGGEELRAPVREVLKSDLFRSSSVDPHYRTWHLSYSLGRLDLFQVISLHRHVMGNPLIVDFIAKTATDMCDFIPEGHADSDATWTAYFKTCLTQALSDGVNKIIEASRKSIDTVEAMLDGLRIALNGQITLPAFYTIPEKLSYQFVVLGPSEQDKSQIFPPISHEAL